MTTSEKGGNRRAFLAGVGSGMLAAGIGATAATEMGFLSDIEGGESKENRSSARLHFGAREKLASQLQETPADKLMPQLVTALQSGLELRELVAAAALANARQFGGEDYIGFHTFMALSPTLTMSAALPVHERPLPILKVLYRNATRIASAGGPGNEVLHALPEIKAVPAAAQSGGLATSIREAVHQQNATLGEQRLAAVASDEQAWNDLLETVHEGAEVHRVVLAHRAWDMRHLVGDEYARTMLRQSLRYCVKAEQYRTRQFAGLSALLAKMFDQYKLEGRPRGRKQADAAWIERMSQTLFRATPAQAADAVAAALAEGFSAESISNAICLTSNQLLLRDVGRTGRSVQPGKPEGSVHGDSIGLHSCDTSNAWRHIAAVSNARNSAASLILAGYHVAQDRGPGTRFFDWKPRPYEDALARVTEQNPEKLLTELDGAIREGRQDLACAIAQRYNDLGHPAARIFKALLSYALSEDGALHAEKFYKTATDEYSNLPAPFRGRQIVALARVSASSYGHPAPGYAQIQQLLKS